FQNVLEVPFTFQDTNETPRKASPDTDLVNPGAGGNIGAFGPTGLIGPLDDSAVRANLKFIQTGNHATFVKTAGSTDTITHDDDIEDAAGNVIRTETRDYVESRKMVSVLVSGPVWTKIEVNFVYRNKGTLRQGFVKSDRLAAIDKYPA